MKYIEYKTEYTEFNSIKKRNITHSGAIEHIAITFSRADESIIFFSRFGQTKKNMENNEYRLCITYYITK